MDYSKACLGLYCAGCLSIGSAGMAQTDAEVNAGIQFDFSTPGARSLAMGGAFVGLADDATAAFTNPAGLLGLRRQEVSFEGRSFQFTNTFTDRGHAFGFVTGVGVDAIEDPRTAEVEDKTSSISFLSYVYPKKQRGAGTEERTRWALAVYRHELVNFHADFRTQGTFFDLFDAEGLKRTARLAPVIAAIDLDIVNFGLSGAYRLSDKLGLGLGVSFYDFEIDSLQQRFSTLGFDPATGERGDDDAPGSLFGPADYSPGNEVNLQRQVGSDEAIAFNVGFLWHLSKLWGLGGVYRQGPQFEFEAANRSGAFIEAFSGLPRGTPIAQQTGRFDVPDVLAVGVAFKPSETIRVAFDYNRIKYSELTEGMISIFKNPEDLSVTEQAAVDALSLADGDAFRVGFEYRFLGLACPGSAAGPCTVGVRLGAWHDPDHKIRFAGDPGLDSDTRSQAIQFLGSDDEIHFSAGFGFVFNQFQIDAAADFSDTVDVISLSGVFRFGGRDVLKP